MPKIKELEQHVADLIAAGEVVRRPASVVKELIENSIDAGASIITIEIASGGMSFMRVTDNGCGIDPKDAKIAFLRHATSKLHSAQGLEAISTLGFRGEALAAISAVSRVELLSREPGAVEGVSLKLEAGEIVSDSAAGCPEGTTIVVRDLFFNTPARLKFMKSDRAESSAVTAVVLRIGLSRPDISFRFIKDGVTEYHTPGDTRIDSCVYSLLGRELGAGFLSAKAADEAVSVSGYVSSPTAFRGNRSYQFFFVNGRSIRSLLLQTALEQAYKNISTSGRFPSCVLYITTKHADVDVNVHPEKAEIKFFSDKKVFDGVYYAALGALERYGKSDISSKFTKQSGGAFENDTPESTYTKTSSESSYAQISAPNLNDDAFKVRESRNTYTLPTQKSTAEAPSSPTSQASAPNNSGKEPFISASASHPPVDNVYGIGTMFDEHKEEHDLASPFSIIDSHFTVIGEALNVCIVVEYKDSVWFIDKHAAHERLHFDALKSESYEPMSEALLTPVVCRFGHESTAILLENTELLDKMGFSVESFGEDCVAVRHIPAEIDISDAESVLSAASIEFMNGGSGVAADYTKLDNIYKMIACKAAIKAGQSSDPHELSALAEKVISGTVSHCPHGRPVAFEITRKMLDKGFGRI